MEGRKFGYGRVSSKEQNEGRQLKIFKEEGIADRDIFIDKESGRSFNRTNYRILVDKILREGDLLVVTELKRFGRNYGEIYKEWYKITKEIKADIKVTSMPMLDTTQSKDILGQLIADVALAIFAYVADDDWRERHELQRQGIEVAKKEGKHMGRPQIEYPIEWEKYYIKWKAGEITAVGAMHQMNIKKDSFYRLVKRYELDSDVVINRKT